MVSTALLDEQTPLEAGRAGRPPLLRAGGALAARRDLPGPGHGDTQGRGRGEKCEQCGNKLMHRLLMRCREEYVIHYVSSDFIYAFD